MSGLLLYKKYLENISECITMYNIEIPRGKGLSDILEVAKDIEDLAYLDAILSNVDSENLFIEEKSFLNKPIRLESKLKGYMDLNDLEGFISYEDLYGIENEIIECCGDLMDTQSDINYKNLGVSSLSFGDEDYLGENKIKEYEDEIHKVFNVMESLKNTYIEEERKNKEEKEKLIETKEEIEEIREETKNKEEKENLIESKEEIEETKEETEDWIEEQDREYINKYAEDEEETEDLEEAINYFLMDDEGDNEVKDLEEHNVEIVDDIEEVEETIEETYENEEFNPGELNSEEIDYKKKGKIVESAYVTEIDDVLAKTILVLNSKFLKIPQSTLRMFGKIKDSSKKIYTNMKVEEEEEEEDEV